MKIQMSVLAAFDHLIENWKGATPKDLHEAKKARAGEREYPLAERGAKSMLRKYGGAKYVVSEIVTFNSEEQ